MASLCWGLVALTLLWDPVTTCTDGSPCVIETYLLYRAEAVTDLAEAFWELAAVVVAPDVQVEEQVPPHVTTCYEVTAVMATGVESLPSTPLCVWCRPHRCSTLDVAPLESFP